MKIVIKILLALCLVYFVLGQDNNKISGLYNQREAYPNQYEAATSLKNLEYANYTAPFLSHVLFEDDPKKKLRKNEFLNSVRFQSYRLIKGETEQIFNFADGNRDDLLDQNEWDNFSGLYILPFEACDKNHDYLLNEEEFAECFEKDPRSRFIVFRRSAEKNKHSEIMWTITTRAKALLNFHDYLFVRRALFAWKQCQSNSKFISKSSFKCALKTAILQKYNNNGDLDQLYEVGLKNSNDIRLVQLDFINYLRTLYSLYVFTSFGHPITIPYIEKNNFIKAIREDRLPTNFEEKEVSYLFDLINTNPLNPTTQMNFASFAFFFNLHKLFNKYSIERPLQITKNEFVNLLNDKWAPQQIVWAIDSSSTNFTIAEYQEASLSLNRKRPNEAKYYYSFKEGQDASENTASIWNKTTEDLPSLIPENPTAREYFFLSYSQLNKYLWDKESFYRAFQLGNLFVSLIPDFRYVVPAVNFVDKLMKQYNIVDPAINFVQRKNYPMYKFLPREVHIDIITFSAIENWREKLKSIISTSQQNVYESFAKMILMDFGMKEMPDTILDLAKKGFDNLRRRTYDPEELMKNCVYVQSIASENRRQRDFVKKYNLPHNDDPARKFPMQNRRSQASPKV